MALTDLGEAVRGFFIESSRWNNTDTAQCILVKIKENPEFDEVFSKIILGICRKLGKRLENYQMVEQ